MRMSTGARGPRSTRQMRSFPRTEPLHSYAGSEPSIGTSLVRLASPRRHSGHDRAYAAVISSPVRGVFAETARVLGFGEDTMARRNECLVRTRFVGGQPGMPLRPPPILDALRRPADGPYRLLCSTLRITRRCREQAG
jgi:hypothetical protein